MRRLPLNNNAAWHGHDILEKPRWQMTFSTDDISDLENALSQCKPDQKDWSEITHKNFLPGRFKQRLSVVATELEFHNETEQQ